MLVCARPSGARDDMLHHAKEGHLDEAYQSIAKEFGYHTSGKASEEDVQAFRDDLGTLESHHWDRYDWTKPVDETSACWWVANLSDVDKKQAVKLVCRSLACLRLELQILRCANSVKLREEWERRVHNNASAVERIQKNLDLWLHVCGPHPEKLLWPNEVDLSVAQEAAAVCKRML